ncbi:MAG: hypothetical protein LBJ08_08945 [Bifidobacteriaceae bacterium]|nr:hypothetical protein [Bifidobacteriaceae bacterium]
MFASLGRAALRERVATLSRMIIVRTHDGASTPSLSTRPASGFQVPLVFATPTVEATFQDGKRWTAVGGEASLEGR